MCTFFLRSLLLFHSLSPLFTPCAHYSSDISTSNLSITPKVAPPIVKRKKVASRVKQRKEEALKNIEVRFRSFVPTLLLNFLFKNCRKSGKRHSSPCVWMRVVTIRVTICHKNNCKRFVVSFLCFISLFL
jgi:hypothetical protein